MERNAAVQIAPMLVEAAAKAAVTLEIYRNTTDEAHYKAYAAAVGKIVAAIDDVLRPIINEYPDLHP